MVRVFLLRVYFSPGPISGGSLNPAVSVAVDVTHLIGTAIKTGDFHHRFWHCFVYSVFECLAGAAAAAVFMLTHPEEFGGYVGASDLSEPHTKFV